MGKMYWARVCIVVRYGLDDQGIESRWWRDIPQSSRPTLGPTKPTVQWVTALFTGGNRPGRDVDHTPPSSTEVKEHSFDISSGNGFHGNFRQCVQFSERDTDIRYDEYPSVYLYSRFCSMRTVTRSKATNIRIKYVAHYSNFYQFIRGYMFRL
jgi:hypothetical protein